MIKTKRNRIILAVTLLLLSATLVATASFAWFAMNTKTQANDFKVEAYSDSLFLEMSSEGATSGFTSTPFSSADQNVKPLRLITHEKAKDGEVYLIDATPISTDTYYTSTDTDTYYKLVKSDVGVDKYNYIKVTDAELSKGTNLGGCYTKTAVDSAFVLQTGKADGTSDYYEKQGSDYVQILPKPTSGTDVKGKYKLDAEPSAIAADTYYVKANQDADDVFYNKFSNGDGEIVYAPVAGLEIGTNLKGFCKFTAPSGVSGEFEKDKTYYVKNNNDYVCIGVPNTTGNTVKIDGYSYWGRAYSGQVDDPESTNTLNVVSAAIAENDYYLNKTFWIRQAEDTNHGKNLRVSDIKVTGAKNDLLPALRVLIVATSTISGVTEKTVVTTEYDADTKKFDGSADEGALFATLLGDAQETVEVQIYIYFDGKDDVSKNTTLASGNLNGLSVSIEFAIDEHDYNK